LSAPKNTSTISFGDTVNIAARLEELSAPMCINVSSTVYQRVGKDFVFSCPIKVEMKGKGLQTTYFLERKTFGLRSGLPLSDP
jgi:class 3 adenylate cyclase